MKVLTVIGARPQFVKASVVSRAFREVGGVEEVIVHTGQHYDANMSSVFFDDLGIPRPGYNLGVGSGSHGVQTGQMMAAIEQVVGDVHPDWVLVYGDTNSTLAGALVAAKLHVPVAHVEAGLRSFNRRMPEEVNRVVTDHLAECLFAPTAIAVRNLENEGIAGSAVHLVGDVMKDAALHFGREAERSSGVLQRLGLHPSSYVLATIHRAENTDVPERLAAICDALTGIGRQTRVVLPLHPRTKNALLRSDLYATLASAIDLIEPVGYLDMLMLEKGASLIATDSGGVQKEAFFFEVPCVTLREETEWVELIKEGWNRLAPPMDGASVLLAIEERLGTRGTACAPYGNGDAAAQIARVISDSYLPESSVSEAT